MRSCSPLDEPPLLEGLIASATGMESVISSESAAVFMPCISSSGTSWCTSLNSYSNLYLSSPILQLLHYTYALEFGAIGAQPKLL